MGTLFLDIATCELALDIQERLHPKGKRIHAEDPFLSFFGSDNVHAINAVTSCALQNAAIIALHSQLPIAVGLNKILTYDRLREDELMLYEARWDDMYFDQEQTQLAFQHAALQWRFYKHGSFLHAIPLTRIKIENSVVGLRIFSHFKTERGTTDATINTIKLSQRYFHNELVNKVKRAGGQISYSRPLFYLLLYIQFSSTTLDQ